MNIFEGNIPSIKYILVLHIILIIKYNNVYFYDKKYIVILKTEFTISYNDDVICQIMCVDLCLLKIKNFAK